MSDIFPHVLGLSHASLNHSELISLTNLYRVQSNLLPLKTNELLNTIAASKAAALVATNSWSHDINGQKPWVMFETFGYQYQYAGENLARNYDSELEVVKAWLNSPGHKANLLNENYQEIGIGIKDSVVVQLFGTPLKTTSGLTSPTFYSPQEILNPTFFISPINLILIILILLATLYLLKFKRRKLASPQLSSAFWHDR